MNEIQISNFDKKSNPTKDQIIILQNANKCTKIIEFLELKTRNDKTRRTYGSVIRDYLVKLNIKDPNKYFLDPRKLSNGKRIVYTDKLEKHVLIFNKSLQTKSGSHRKTNLSAIRRFFEYNKIDLGNSFWEETRKNGKKAERQTDTETPTQEQLKNILSRGDTEGKAFFLTIMTSGSRVSEVLYLTFDNLHLDTDPPSFKVPENLSKTGRPITKFITPEAKYYLEQYLKERNKILETRINRSNYIKHNEQQFRKKYENRVFPMGNTNPETMWKNLLTKEGLYKKDSETTNYPTMGIHSLRRYFEDNLGNGKLSKYLQNKTSKSEEPYQYKTQGKLQEEYKKHMINLYVFEETEETKAKIQENKQTIIELQIKLEEANEKSEKQKSDFEFLHKETNRKLDELTKQFHQSLHPYPDDPLDTLGTAGYKYNEEGERIDFDINLKTKQIEKVSKSRQNKINIAFEDEINFYKVCKALNQKYPNLSDDEIYELAVPQYEKLYPNSILKFLKTKKINNKAKLNKN